MNFRLFIGLILLLASPASFAQRVERVAGEYVYYAPPNITIEQAQQTAIDKAKVTIIADHFGTIVRSDMISVMGSNVNESLSIGETEVKGEWLRTIGEPDIHISFEQDMLVVRVKISGEIREIKESKIDFDAEVICGNNGVLLNGFRFKSGNDLYLSFLSPVSGYVAAYLYCSDGIFRLLPDYMSGDGSFSVKGGKPYVFFKQEEGTQYVLTCNGTSEANRIYIIFSPNKFYRANDIGINGEVPMMSFDDFNKWLGKCRRQDQEMSVKSIDILIEN